MALEFTKQQELILLQQAVAVRPFSQGKGQGWKMIASALMKHHGYLPATLKLKTVREKILILMDQFAEKPSVSSTESGIASDDEDVERNHLLQQLMDLRDEAVRVATQRMSSNVSSSEDMVKSNEREDTGCPSPERGTSLGKDVGGPKSKESTLVAPIDGQDSPSKEKGKVTLSEPECSGSKSTEKAGKKKPMGKKQPKGGGGMARKRRSVDIVALLEDREAKRRKLREEELAVRKEELAERKKMVQLLEERLAEEKKIREQMFEIIANMSKK